MRMKRLLAAMACIAAFGLAAPGPSAASDLDLGRAPHNFEHPREVHHYVYTPRYAHVYHVRRDDPYSYEPRLPRYYPYYNSGYWRPAETMRYRYRTNYQRPPYYKAWGYNTRKWYLKHGHERRRDARELGSQ